MPMDTNPMSHPRIGFTDDGTISKDTASDSWFISRSGDPSEGASCRLELYSESCSKKWLNVEITWYSYLIEDYPDPKTGEISSYITHVYTRGGTHSHTRKCEGSAYKGRLQRPSGGVNFTKEIQHDDYCPGRANPAPAQFLTECSGIDRFIGGKFIVYNMPHDPTISRTPVKLEYWADEGGMAKNGVFTAANQNWRLLGSTRTW
jgi:hypothetical protein